jgi:hypothetical protein
VMEVLVGMSGPRVGRRPGRDADGGMGDRRAWVRPSQGEIGSDADLGPGRRRAAPGRRPVEAELATIDARLEPEPDAAVGGVLHRADRGDGKCAPPDRQPAVELNMRAPALYRAGPEVQLGVMLGVEDEGRGQERAEPAVVGGDRSGAGGYDQRGGSGACDGEPRVEALEVGSHRVVAVADGERDRRAGVVGDPVPIREDEGVGGSVEAGHQRGDRRPGSSHRSPGAASE